MNNDDVQVTFEESGEPDISKLARALISLSMRERADDDPDAEQTGAAA